MTATQIAIDTATIATTPLTDAMTLDQWTQYGRDLFAAEKRISWAIADWWAFGDQRYGERAGMVAKEIFGRSFQTLMNAGSTARAFPEASRQQEVSFTHHQEAAALARENPEAASALLDMAADGMSAAQVREAQREIRNPEPRAPQPPRDDDSLLSGFLHHWNRLPRSVRLAAAEIIADANGEVVDPA